MRIAESDFGVSTVLHADDKVILAEKPTDLQCALSSLLQYRLAVT